MSSKIKIASLVVLGSMAAWYFVFGKGGSTADLPALVDYNYHIKPILSDRCFKCHGPDKAKQEAELGLDSEAGLFKRLKDDSSRFVVVPGKPNESELYRRIISTDTAELMPPPESHLSLDQREVAIIKKWIEQGANYKPHWAFIPPVKPALPTVKKRDWPKNGIDYFVLQKLENEGLKPNPMEEKEKLLRRASFDLTGLPPTLDMLDRFVNDQSSSAFEKIVEELLSQPAYAEHQASRWLDLARYADSHGYQDDSFRAMWPWRDWVIHAFDKNMPYDQFVTWQLAGDLLPNATREQVLATGFCRNHKITQEGGVIEEEYRVEYICDKTNTFGKAFLGLTYECARCHDHKYDPISQKEYFETYAFFNQNNERGFYGDVSNVSIAEHPTLVPTKAELEGILNFINDEEADTVVSMVMQESDTFHRTFVLKRGQYDAPAEEVGFGTPATIMPYPTDLPKNRLGLSQWLFDRKNPLTARVTVNRVWQDLFGVGLVKSSDNFGNQGDLPSHPELLDWLAVEFMENGWDMKYLLKLITTSSTYRQSAVATRQQLEEDPENRLLGRGPRQRLTPEMIRDSWLATSGLLVRKIGGPPVRPYQPEGLWEETNPGEGRGTLTKYVQDTGDKLYRRTMYTIFKRTLPPPFLTTFDASYRDVCAVSRQSTNTPLQALNLMNDPMMLESCRFFAQKTLSEESNIAPQHLVGIFRSIVSRQPSGKELELLEAHFRAALKKYGASPELAQSAVKLGGTPPGNVEKPALLAATASTIALVFNMDEAINR